MPEAIYSTYELRVRAVKALLSGQRMVDVAQSYQVNYSTLYRWKERYRNGKAFSGLERKEGSGRCRILTFDEFKQLVEIIFEPASEFGYETDFWTCRRLIQVTKKELKVTLSQPTMWRMLRDAGLTYQKPERRYFEGDDEIRRRWLRYEVPKIKRTVTKYRAILYFEDEASISLTAFLGKTWAPVGETPTQEVTGARGSVAAMSAISKTGQLVFTLHNKRIASPEVIHFLDQLLQHHKRRHLVVVMDKAPPHTSKKTKHYIESQKRLHVFNLPSYSPHWNPDEYVWNHLKHQELKGHQAKTKEELRKITQKKLKKMSRNPSLLRGIFFRCCIANFMN